MAGFEWDEELGDTLINTARAWFQELTVLTQLKIPRCLPEKGKAVDTVTLHTFVDASENAYGAVTYARYSYQDGSISTNIVTAKTRVAPSKALSIPRLELMGADRCTVIKKDLKRYGFKNESVGLLVRQFKRTLVDTREKLGV